MEYTFEEINIGDEVIFNSTELQSNYDLYWKVIGKIEDSNKLIVRLDEMGHNDLKWTIDLKEVIRHISF